MIRVRPVDSETVFDFELNPMKGEAAFIAYHGESTECAGYCVYTKGLDTVKLLRLETMPHDIEVADMLVRSILAVCEDTARWAVCSDDEQLQEYREFCRRFIHEGGKAEISSFFGGCCG